MVHGTKVRLRSTKDGDGTVDREGGGNCRPMHVPSATGGNVTKRLEMFAVGDALAVAVGNGAPVGGAPTRVESIVRPESKMWVTVVIGRTVTALQSYDC